MRECIKNWGKAMSLDNQAFMTELYEQYYRLMISVAQQCIQGSRVAYADVVQESLLRLLEQVEILKELQPEQQAAYVVKTTRRVAYRHVLRERQSSQQYQSLDDCKDTLQVASPEPDMAVRLSREEEKEEIRRLVQRTLRKMTREERMLLRGKYLEGYSDEQLARRVGCKPDSIRMKLTRARRKMLQKLRERGTR